MKQLPVTKFYGQMIHNGGTAGDETDYDFVMTKLEPTVVDPDGAKAIDRQEHDPDWFDFSKVTAGQPYDKDGVVGRLIPGNVSVDTIKANIIGEEKSQAGMT